MSDDQQVKTQQITDEHLLRLLEEERLLKERAEQAFREALSYESMRQSVYADVVARLRELSQ